MQAGRNMASIVHAVYTAHISCPAEADLDVPADVALEAAEEDLALAGLEAVHHVGD